MDNFHLDITSDENLPIIIALAFSKVPGKKATDYIVETTTVASPRLILHWHPGGDTEQLLYPLRVEDNSAYAFIKGWLDNQVYPPEPDHDGSNKRGFRIYNEAWGRIGQHTYSFVAIEPAWATYGK